MRPYLGLQENLADEIWQGNDIIANAAVPGQSQMLVFASPESHGSYQGFEYDAIAIAYENTDIVDVLDISALMEMPRAMLSIRWPCCGRPFVRIMGKCV